MADFSYGQPVSPVFSHTNGHSHTNYGALTSTPVLIVGNPCQLMRVYALSPSSSQLFLQLFDTSILSGVTVGVTQPTDIFGIPATPGVASFQYDWTGDQYKNGICAAIVGTTALGHSTGAPIPVSFAFH